MSYLVLARKYRPRSFAEMVGQEHVLQALINALEQQRLHHAYLFTGTRGVGKTTIARILAKCLNCETKGITSEPCGECAACREIGEGRFVDLLEVDAASRTKVEDTRELLDNVQYAPTRGRFKVYLIDEVHMLSAHSFNALLKTLEEPPPHVKFLLATTDPQKLPVTILSRCLQFSLKNMTPERVKNHLAHVLSAEQIDFEEAALWHLGRAADGSMRDALSLTDQAISYAGGRITEAQVCAMLGTLPHHRVRQLAEALASGEPSQCLAYVAEIAEQGPDFHNLLTELVVFLHRLAIAQLAPQALDNSLGDLDAVMELSEKMSAADVQLYYQMGLLARRDMPLAPDPRGGFEMALLRMLAFRPVGPEGAEPAKKKPQANLQTTNKSPANTGLTKAPIAAEPSANPAANPATANSPVMLAPPGQPDQQQPLVEGAASAHASATRAPEAKPGEIAGGGIKANETQPDPARANKLAVPAGAGDQVSEALSQPLSSQALANAQPEPTSVTADGQTPKQTARLAAKQTESQTDIATKLGAMAASVASTGQPPSAGPVATPMTTEPRPTGRQSASIPANAYPDALAPETPRPNSPAAETALADYEAYSQGDWSTEQTVAQPPAPVETSLAAASELAEPLGAQSSAQTTMRLSQDNWPAFCACLPLAGLAKNMARNMQLTALNNQQLEFATGREQMPLLNASVREQLQKAICALDGRNFRMVIHEQEGLTQTPQALNESAQAAERQGVQQAFMQDPLLSELQQGFDAKVDYGALVKHKPNGVN